MKMDDYLEANGTTRYQVSKISGIYASAFQNASEQELKNVPVKYFQAIGLVLGKTSGQVLDEMTADENPVFNFLAKYQITDKKRVGEILDHMNYFDKHHIDVSNISFNRFEQEDGHTQDDALLIVDNLIEVFRTMRSNHEDWHMPLPE